MEEFEPTIATGQTEEPLAAPTSSGDVEGQSDPETGQNRWRMLRELTETVLLTVVIFAVVNTITGRFRIEGPSMQPNLSEGQYLIINKIVYKLHPPQRGDIIVFHHPQQKGRDLIKRVIGLPGETIDIQSGQVFIDDSPLEEPYVLRPSRYSVNYKLGAHEYYVLGDNRSNSDDSHNWGVVGIDEIVGKAWVSYWPPEVWGGVLHYDYSESSTTQENGTLSTRPANTIGRMIPKLLDR